MVRDLALDMNISSASQLQYTITGSGLARKFRLFSHTDSGCKNLLARHSQEVLFSMPGQLVPQLAVQHLLNVR
jgi:hypothetical protein